MAFIKQAQPIINGIAKYNQALEIYIPRNIGKCLEVLRSRKKVAVQLILGFPQKWTSHIQNQWFWLCLGQR